MWPNFRNAVDAGFTGCLQFGHHWSRATDSGRSAALRASNMNGVLRFLTTTAVVLALCCSCTSIRSHTRQSSDSKGAYSGVQGDARLLAHPNSLNDSVTGHVSPALVVPYSIVDLPLSVALDTLLLPIDLTYHKSNAPAAIQLELQDIKLGSAVLSETPDGPSTVPVRLKIANPRPKAVKLKIGCLTRIIRCSDYVDVDGQKWELPWGGFKATDDNRAVVSLEARSESEFELAVPTGRELLRPVGLGRGIANGVPVPTSLKFSVRDSHVQTESDAWIPVGGSGTVSVQR